MKKDEIIEVIEREGLDYALLDYLNPVEIEDGEIYQEWINAVAALNSLKSVLGI
jgi:hypothetical protein